MEQGTGIFSVAIDFDQSHLFFPGIIQWVLLILAVAIALVHGREFARNIRGASLLPDRDSFDVVRVFGTLGLVVLYFVSMNWVGQLFPNTGMGFLLMSIPFMIALSLLYVHDLDRKKLLVIVANAVLSPLVAWYVLAQLFFITLP